MKVKNGNNYLVLLNILIIVYNLYISLTIFSEKIILTDDLARVYELRAISESYFSYIHSFLDSATMAARPVSGWVTGTLFYFSKNNESFYLLGTLFFPLSLVVIYWVTKKIFTKELASLITLLYSSSIMGTSIQFSSLMLNSNLATIFFALSIYYAYVQNKIIPSALCFIASVLSYEIFIPLFLLHLFIIKENKKSVLFVLLTMGVIVLFRKFIQPNLFLHSYQRDILSKIFDLKHISFSLVCAIKLFFKDLFTGLCKGLLNIGKLNVVEMVFSLIIPVTVYKVFSKYDFKSRVGEFKKLSIISVISILLALSIFFFSSYIPTLFGFDNRNLGAIRLFYTLLIISGLIYVSVKLKLQNRTICVLFTGITFILVTTNISVKNSWIYANQFNKKLFSKLNTALQQNNIKSGNICVEYDMFNELKSNPNLTLREPLFYNDWEAPLLSEMNGIDPQKIHIYNNDKKVNCEVIFYYQKGKIIRTK